MNHDLTPSSCIEHLVTLIKNGQLRTELQTNFGCVLACVLIAVGGMVHRLFAKPETFGSSLEKEKLDAAMLNLSAVLGTERPPVVLASQLSGVLDGIVQKIILDLLKKFIAELDFNMILDFIQDLFKSKPEDPINISPQTNEPN